MEKSSSPSTTANSTTSFSSSNTSLAPQNMTHPLNFNILDNSGQLSYPGPYFVPYDPNLMLQHVQQFSQVNQYPMYPFPTGQSSVAFSMPNSELQGLSLPREQDRAYTSRVARDKRKQAIRQKSRSSTAGHGAPMVPEGTIKRQPSGGSNVKMTVKQNFCTPDGKNLEEILTKKLRNSDVGVLGRIVLPKREAEEKLPPLSDKEVIDLVLKNVYSDELQWTLKYRPWTNNKSRMYVLENTVDFVNDNNLLAGDRMTLLEDELKNLYVLIKRRESVPKESLHARCTYNYGHMHPPYALQAKDAEAEAEAEAANIAMEYQVPNNATKEAAAALLDGHAVVMNDDDQNNFDEVYGSLDNILEIGQNYHGFEHLTDYMNWS